MREKILVKRRYSPRYRKVQRSRTSKLKERFYCKARGHKKSEKKLYYGPHRVYNENAYDYRCECCKKVIKE